MDEINDINNMDVVYGMVTNIKSITSLGVTRIEIEVPKNFHKEVTNLLYEKGVIMVPMWEHTGVPVTYGVRKMGQFLGTIAANDEPAPSAAPSKIVPRRAEPETSGIANKTDLVKQAGLMCRDNRVFWQYLSNRTENEVTSEDDAAMAVKILLSIASRTELRDNVRAQRDWAALLRDFNMTANA